MLLRCLWLEFGPIDMVPSLRSALVLAFVSSLRPSYCSNKYTYLTCERISMALGALDGCKYADYAFQAGRAAHRLEASSTELKAPVIQRDHLGGRNAAEHSCLIVPGSSAAMR